MQNIICRAESNLKLRFFWGVVFFLCTFTLFSAEAFRRSLGFTLRGSVGGHFESIEADDQIGQVIQGHIGLGLDLVTAYLLGVGFDSRLAGSGETGTYLWTNAVSFGLPDLLTIRLGHTVAVAEGQIRSSYSDANIPITFSDQLINTFGAELGIVSFSYRRFLIHFFLGFNYIQAFTGDVDADSNPVTSWTVGFKAGSKPRYAYLGNLGVIPVFSTPFSAFIRKR